MMSTSMYHFAPTAYFDHGHEHDNESPTFDLPPPPLPPSPTASTPTTPQEHSLPLPPSPKRSSRHGKRSAAPVVAVASSSSSPPPPCSPSLPPPSSAPTISTFSASSATNFNHIHIVQPYAPGGNPFQTIQVYGAMTNSDDPRPPRPSNAWILYRSAKMKALSAPSEGPRQTQADISKVIAQMWKNEAPDVRQYYEQLSDMKKAEHMAAYPGYRFQPMKKTDKEQQRLDKKAEREADRERARVEKTLQRGRTGKSKRKQEEIVSFEPASADVKPSLSPLDTGATTSVISFAQPLPGTHVLAFPSSKPEPTSAVSPHGYQPYSTSSSTRRTKKTKKPSPLPTSPVEEKPVPSPTSAAPVPVPAPTQPAVSPVWQTQTQASHQFSSYTAPTPLYDYVEPVAPAVSAEQFNAFQYGAYPMGWSVDSTYAQPPLPSLLDGWIAPGDTSQQPDHRDILGFDVNNLFASMEEAPLPPNFDFNFELGQLPELGEFLSSGAAGMYDPNFSLQEFGSQQDMTPPASAEQQYYAPVPIAPTPVTVSVPTPTTETCPPPQQHYTHQLPARSRPAGPPRIVTGVHTYAGPQTAPIPSPHSANPYPSPYPTPTSHMMPATQVCEGEVAGYYQEAWGAYPAPQQQQQQQQHWHVRT